MNYNAQAFGKPINIITLILSLLAIIGYAFNIESLYRPITGGPATHPLTATLIILLTISNLLSYLSHSRKWPLTFVLIPLAILISKLIDLSSDTNLSVHITPFLSVVEQDTLDNKSNTMGLNTTLMLLLVTLSYLSFFSRYLILSQLCAFLALSFPMVSITGYAYGLESFYGDMSLLSTTFGVFICLTALSITANIGGIKAILSPYIGGRIARVQVVLGYTVPLIIGYMVILSVVNSNQIGAFGIYVVAISWFIILLVVASAIFQERVDFQRRAVEHALIAASFTDYLTTLPNRRRFMERAEQLLQQCIEDDSDLWVLMIDIDHFKKVNDSAGHAVGDQVLIQVAQTLSQSIEKEDLVCRLGGEEFAVLAIRKPQSDITDYANKLRESVAATVVDGYTELYGKVSISLGCSLFKNSIDSTLQSADEALYTSKESGRNRVTVYKPNEVQNSPYSAACKI